ncbi:hypothetical protein TNCV_1427801, partial [Trichonephila clavipes]
MNETTLTGENNSTQQQERTTQLGSRNETTQLVSRNETTQLNRRKTTQLVSRNETTQLCTAVNRLRNRPATALRTRTTINNRLQPPATAYNRLQPPTQPPATACNRLGNRLQTACATASHRLYSRIGFF